MESRDFIEIVFCCAHAGRAYSRKIYSWGKLVHLWPLDDAELEDARQHHHDRFVRVYKGPIIVPADYHGCPFCGRSSVSECSNCRMLSCVLEGTDDPWHRCPCCGTIGALREAQTVAVAKAGYIAPAALPHKLVGETYHRELPFDPHDMPLSYRLKEWFREKREKWRAEQDAKLWASSRKHQPQSTKLPSKK